MANRIGITVARPYMHKNFACRHRSKRKDKPASAPSILQSCSGGRPKRLIVATRVFHSPRLYNARYRIQNDNHTTWVVAALSLPAKQNRQRVGALAPLRVVRSSRNDYNCL